MYSDWSILAKLLLGFVHLSDEIDEALSGFWHPLLWPVGELELADCSGLAILRDKKVDKFRGIEDGQGGRRVWICQKTGIERMCIACDVQRSSQGGGWSEAALLFSSFQYA